MRTFNVTYNTWKTIFTNHSSSWSAYQYPVKDDERKVWTGNSEYIYHTVVDSENYPDYSSSIEPVTTVVSSTDDAKALIIGLSHIRDTHQANNALRVVMDSREGTEVIRATHNYADETTWFHEATSRVSQSLVPVDENNLIFSSSNSSHINWVDLEHGKVHREHLVEAPYHVTVRVDGVEKTKQIWSNVPGGDYRVKSYASGTIEFFEEVTGSVDADFHTANGSCWVLAPSPGKILKIESAESQFSSDSAMNDGIVFEVYGYVDVFAPHLTPVPLPSGTKIQLKKEEYKSFGQIVDDAVGAYPVIPSIGGLRGIENDIHGFPFSYATTNELNSEHGLEVRVSLSNDLVLSGSRVTVTFYCIEEDI